MLNSPPIRLLGRRSADLETIEAPVLAGEPVEPVDFNELARKVWRRKWTILATAAALMAVTAIVLSQLTPIYRAQALVMVEARQPKFVNIQQVLSGLPPDEETIRSEIEVLRSRDLARQTITQLGLDRLPEFNPKPARDSLWNRLERWIGLRPDRLADATQSHQTRQSRIVDEFESRLTVAAQHRSRVIAVGFDSADPILAANIVNRLVDGYLVSQLQAKFDATQRANNWLNDRLKGLREQVLASDRAVAAYRKQAGLLRSETEGGTKTTIAIQELAGIDKQLVQAQGDRVAAEAKLDQVRSVLASGAGAQALSIVLQSPIIQNLRAQQAEVERREADLGARFGKSYPPMISARAEADGIQQKIDAETANILQSLKNDVDVARAREGALQARLDQAKAQTARLDQADVHLRALEREADANENLYNTFLERFKETSSQAAGLEQPDARVISRADVPDAPAYPKTKIILSLAAVVASIAGIALAFLLDRLDRGFRSMDQIEAATGYGSLGLVPIQKELAGRKERGRTRLPSPNTPFAEALRSLATKLLLLEAREAPKTILFSSSLPQEGKTTIGISLACLQASIGRKVAFVDCDLRRPVAHLEFQVPRKRGLVDYLSGAASLDAIWYTEPHSGVTVIPAGRATRDPAGLLASQSMKMLLRALAQTHDIVILDSAPVLAVSDALALCGLVDKTVFLVHWGKSRQALVLRGLQALVDAGADLAGIVLSRVDVRKHARYGYSDSGLYLGPAREYAGEGERGAQA